jgi:hypothetical protein
VVEGLPELDIPEGLGEVLRSEESVAHRASDGGGESWLVLRDRTLEEADPPAAEPWRLVWMEEHPDGHRVGQAPGQGPEPDGEDNAQDLVVHGSV